MMQSKTLEIWVGLFVVAGLAALFMLAMKASNLNKAIDKQGYNVVASFENVGSLKVRSPVTVAGVRIGRVADIRFDNKTYEAVVTLRIDADYNALPEDTTASVFTSGLLGEQYIGLEPGGSEQYLKDGDKIRLTQSAVVLEQIIGQVLFKKAAE